MDFQIQKTFCKMHNEQIEYYEEGEKIQGFCKICITEKLKNFVLAEDHEKNQKNRISHMIAQIKTYQEIYKQLYDNLNENQVQLEKSYTIFKYTINYLINKFNDDLSQLIKSNCLNFPQEQYQKQFHINKDRFFKLNIAYQDFVQQSKTYLDQISSFCLSKLDLLNKMKDDEFKNSQNQEAFHIQVGEKQQYQKLQNQCSLDIICQSKENWIYKLNIQEQCQKGILCQSNQCQFKHYRCFAGICLKGRQNNSKKGECGDDQCKLLHLCQKGYKCELNILPINGIFRFNICKDAECKQQNDCPFLHPQWAQKCCYQYLMNDCEDESHSNHLEWNDLRALVYLEYSKKLKMKCNPEEKLEEESNYFQTNKICMKYLQGFCEKKNGLCQQQHIFWEELDRIGFIKKMTLRSCIEENSSKNFEQLKKQQGQPLQMNEKELQHQQKAIKEQNFIIDIIIIMDLTESMKYWKDVCLSQIKGIVILLKKSILLCTLRVGLVGYRDIGDKEKIVYHELTSDIDVIIGFICKQQTKGQGDDAEDVCSGIEKAMTLNISKDVGSILITILLADAPCHGKQYHNGVSDNLANKVPPNTLENLMKRYYRMKNNSFFICVNITPHTKKMFEVMKANFPGLFISEPSGLSQFIELSTALYNLMKIDQTPTINKLTSQSQSVKEEQYFTESQKVSCQANSSVQDNFCQCCKQIFQIKLDQGIAIGTNVNRCQSCKSKCKNNSDQNCAYCNMSCLSFLNYILIGEKKITICKKGIAYLETLECQICKDQYDFSILLEMTKYKKGIFYCGGEECKKQKMREK